MFAKINLKKKKDEKVKVSTIVCMLLVLHVVGREINEQIMNEDGENVELCICIYI